MHPGQAKCGAKTRQGGAPCKDIAMANGRCKRHGGKSTGPKTTLVGDKNPNANSGIYSQFLSEEDKKIYESAAGQVGAVEHELQLVRLRLARTVKARAAWEASLEAPDKDAEDSFAHVETISDQFMGGDDKDKVVETSKKTFRLPDFDRIEHTCLARIESLEKTRRELLKLGEDDDDADPNAPRDRITFTGGLDGGNDDKLPSPFKKSK